MMFELLQADADTAEGMRHSMARGLPDLINYLNNQTEAGRLRSMHPVLAIQLLAGPIVVNLFTRPLAEALIDFEMHSQSSWTRSCTPGYGPWPPMDAPMPTRLGPQYRAPSSLSFGASACSAYRM